MPAERTVLVDPDPSSASAFEVKVRDGRGESRHRVTISASDKARGASLGAAPAQSVEAARAFLLDREPKESILPRFDFDDIRRYFPEFDKAFPSYAARVQISDSRLR